MLTRKLVVVLALAAGSVAAAPSQAAVTFQNPGNLTGWDRVYTQKMGTNTVVSTPTYRGGTAYRASQVYIASDVANYHAEVVKNSLFPATGCMYLAGWDGIVRLRRAVEARDGSSFSRRRFHDRLLAFGSLPVALVAETLLAEPSGA